MVPAVPNTPSFEFSSARCPLARRPIPPLPASVSASPASGLVPALGKNETNGLMVILDCCAAVAAIGESSAEVATAVEKNLSRCTRCSQDGGHRPLVHGGCQNVPRS